MDSLKHQNIDSRLIHIRLPAGIHRALKSHVAQQDTTMQDFVLNLIEKQIGKIKAGKVG